MTDWKSQRTQALVFGVGSIILGLVFDLLWSFVGIGTRYGNPLPPSPVVGLAISMVGLAVGLGAFRYALRHPSGVNAEKKAES